MSDQAHTGALGLLVPYQQSVTLKIKSAFLANAWVEKCSVDKKQTSQDLCYHFQHSLGWLWGQFLYSEMHTNGKVSGCQGSASVRKSLISWVT